MHLNFAMSLIYLFCPWKADAMILVVANDHGEVYIEYMMIMNANQMNEATNAMTS